MSSFLVTGGAGFIGSHVVDTLILAGHSVRIIDSLVNGKRVNVAKEADLIEADITDYDAVQRAMKGVDGVFHLAALPRVPYSVEHPLKTARVNVNGTLHVLEAARRERVKRVVLSSTSAIYGNSRSDWQSPEDPVELLSPYALHKYTNEQFAKQYHTLYGLETVCLRYFNVFGPRMDDEGGYGSVIAIFKKQKAQGRPLTIEGDGSQGRDFVSVFDVARANILAMSCSSVGAGEILNIGTGKSVSVKQIAQAFGGDLLHIAARQNDVQNTRANILKTTELLNWRPEVLFEDGLHAILE